MLKKLQIKNFKSFKDFEIELDKFNCVIAPNNAGKSNLIYAMNFLYYAIVNVEEAIEEFGGFNNIKNIFLEEDYIEFDLLFFKEKLKKVGFRELENKESEKYIELFKKLQISVNIKILNNRNWEKRYKIKGRFGKKIGIETFDDVYYIESNFKGIKTYPFEIELLYSNNEENIKCELIKVDAKNKKNLLYALKLQDLINNHHIIFGSSQDLFNLRDYFFAYSFYPEIIKTSLKGGNQLRFDGCNLVEVLNFIKNIRPQNFENISTSLIGIVEELNDIKIDKDLIDRNILLFEEKGKFLPFNVVSDGTINLISILTAIYEPMLKKMICFDEIEKHLHLKAIDYILEVLKSQYFQVIFTTQSSEVLNNLDLKKDNLIFLYRDYEGFTKGLNSNKIPNLQRKIKRYKDISTIIKNEVLGYLGDFNEN